MASKATISHKILVTGGSGFIGKHLVEALLSENSKNEIFICDLVPLVRQSENVTCIMHDIRSLSARDIPQDIDCCYHLAALSREPGYNWDEYFDINYRGTERLLSVLTHTDVKRIIYTSTMMVYRPTDNRLSDEALTSPSTAYGMSKLLGEWAIREWAGRQHCAVRILRPAVVFGLGDDGNFTTLLKAVRSGFFVYVGRKTTIKSWIYVKDLVKALLHQLHNDGPNVQIYNAAFDEETTIQDIVEGLCAALGVRRRFPVVPYRLALLTSYVFKLLDAVGIKNPIHPRRIQKLYESTNIGATKLAASGCQAEYSLLKAISDWIKEDNQRKQDSRVHT